MHARAARLAVLACVALCTAGCADKRMEHGVFRAGNYLVAVPSGWQVESDSRADLALARQGAPGGMLVHATCEGRAPRRTLPQIAQAVDFFLVCFRKRRLQR